MPMKTHKDATLTHEKVVRLRAKPAHLEQFHKIKKLPVDIAAYLYLNVRISISPGED